jgi:hypothetical protein
VINQKNIKIFRSAGGELFFILVGKKNDLEADWILYIAHGKQWGINRERNK